MSVDGQAYLFHNELCLYVGSVIRTATLQSKSFAKGVCIQVSASHYIFSSTIFMQILL